jgi:CubicO group peptidase (beta-lactamase class C family)
MNPRIARILTPAVTLALALLFASLPVRAEKPSQSAIAGRLQPFVDNHVLAGGVTLVASKDRVLDLGTVGYADIAAKKPMQKDSLFWIASMSKPITAAAFMILVDEGKVKIDDPVEKYLPEFKGQWLVVEQDGEHMLLRKPKHPITVKNILSHTSGLPFASKMETPTFDLLPLRDAVRSYAMTPLQFEPDTKFQYSNAGINTAGRIIEVVSRMPYEEFLQKRLFDPLGMKDTTFWPSEEQQTRLAKAYKANADNSDLEETPVAQVKYPLNDRSKRYPFPGGGMFSTAGDVGNFCRMVLAGGTYEGKQILTPEAVKQMTSVQTGDLPRGYGLGWFVEKKPGGAFDHGGAYSTKMTVIPEKGLALVLLIHHGGFRDKDDNGKIHAAFQKAAVDRFGK